MLLLSCNCFKIRARVYATHPPSWRHRRRRVVQQRAAARSRKGKSRFGFFFLIFLCFFSFLLHKMHKMHWTGDNNVVPSVDGKRFWRNMMKSQFNSIQLRFKSAQFQQRHHGLRKEFLSDFIVSSRAQKGILSSAHPSWGSVQMIVGGYEHKAK